MSCRHNLANTTCKRCCPETGTIDPGPKSDYLKIYKETMLFACHGGIRGIRAHDRITEESRIVGLISQNTFPLAFSEDIESGREGLHAAYKFFATKKDFFRAIFGPITVIDSYYINNGIWAYDVEYELDSDGMIVHFDRKNAFKDEWWKHLQGGKLRRPTEIELSFLTGNDGECSIHGWVLL
jgi:hypothetical protein